MSKSAMQELIDELDLVKIVDRNKLTMVRYIIDQLLEKEKEQIIDAFSKGYMIGEDFYMKESSIVMAIKYYNQTYNQNK